MIRHTRYNSHTDDGNDNGDDDDADNGDELQGTGFVTINTTLTFFCTKQFEQSCNNSWIAIKMTFEGRQKKKDLQK